MRLRPVDLLFIAAFLTALPLAAQARESDRQQSMSIEADDTNAVLDDDGETTLTGNVSITQGTLKITAHSATIARKAGDISGVLFQGTPATLQQENDNGALMKAQGNRIDYDVAAESVTLTGNVLVDQAGDNLRGERIVYDLKNGRLNGQGDGSGDGRIRMTIQPKPTATTPAKPGPAKSADVTTPPASKEEGGKR